LAACAVASIVLAPTLVTTSAETVAMKAFENQQAKAREKLWSLLGELPRNHKPSSPRLIRSEHRGRAGSGYQLQHLQLDLNGIEPVPALLLIPDRRDAKSPGMLYLHWHGGDYARGKSELMEGNRGLSAPYAETLSAKGIVTLAIDSWCFGERNHGVTTSQIESDTFKEMLWRGRVLWGMMIWDEFQAVTHLSNRPEVDSERIGVMGMSMGATKAWWLAALDPRVTLCVDICCLTDYDELLRNNGLQAHGIYYFVPALLKHFNTSQINELIVPRARLSVNGRNDPLTPPRGVEKVREYLLRKYTETGQEDNCRIELFDCGHQETPEMRALVDSWIDEKWVSH
jgi:hypothetical protein